MQQLLLLLLICMSMHSTSGWSAAMQVSPRSPVKMTAAVSDLATKLVALSQKRAAAGIAATSTLIAVVARKRSISKHLHFLDLEKPAAAQLHDVVLPDGFRLEPDDLVLPDYCTLAADDLHLTMGGALTERLGDEDSARVMSQVRAGQIVLVTAIFDAAENAMVCLDCIILAEPVLEGWEAGVWIGTGDADQYLQLDIADESIVLVDDAAKLLAMSKHLHAATATAAVIGLDCEWQPARIKGDRSPASLLQLAVDNTVYVVDLLRCCRTELTTRAELSATEQLLNDALSTLLSSAEVIKTGLQPRNDLLQLSRTYKHMPCFSKFDGVVDLFQLGTHAVSLGAVMRNDRSSLSKLSEIVLGKRLNKAEQVILRDTIMNSLNIYYTQSLLCSGLRRCYAYNFLYTIEHVLYGGKRQRHATKCQLALPIVHSTG